GLRAADRTMNCLALLDNTDSPSGRSFMELLVSSRQILVESGAPCDPLVVVATSRSAEVVPARSAGRLTRGADGSYAAWAEARQRCSDEASWWYPIALDGLTAEETARAVRSADLDLQGLAGAIHGLTGGHPWTVNAIIEAVRDRAAQQGANGIDLRGLFDLPAPGTSDGSAASLGQRALERWLAHVDPAVRPALVACAAAPGIRTAVSMPSDGRPELPGTLLSVIRGDLLQESWWEGGLGLSPLIRLHPLLRWLLLRSLAARSNGNLESWDRVHSEMRDHLRE